MELYFIRHGQSENNANWQDPNYAESPDPELTQKGIEQARLLAEFISARQQLQSTDWNAQNRLGFGLTHVYASLMSRAVKTAAPTAQALGLPFAAWVDIHEEGGIFSRGDKTKLVGLPGKPRSFFEQHYPEFALPDSLDETGWWNRPFETDEERQPRADRFFAEFLKRHGDQPGCPEHRVAIFSHGGFFMRLMCSMLNLPWKQASNQLQSWFLLHNASISRFDFRQNDLVICYLNRTDHLPDHLIT